MPNYTINNLAQNPNLLDQVMQLAQYWEEFMQHDLVAYQHFGRLYDTFLDYQLAVCDEDGTVVARALSIPIRWDGNDESLPNTGWNWALINGVETHESGESPTSVSAIEISIVPEHRGKGLSRIALQAMKDSAKSKGFDSVVAPVRPSLKHRYPLTPIENYVRWTQPDSDAPFDPWLRVHWRDGARLVSVATKSMEIRGTIAEWERWTEMRFPESGAYIVPSALVPVEIDHESDEGFYFEPNVWMVHPIP